VSKCNKNPGHCNMKKSKTRLPTDVCVDEENIEESIWRKNEKTGNVIWMSSVQHSRQRFLQNR